MRPKNRTAGTRRSAALLIPLLALGLVSCESSSGSDGSSGTSSAGPSSAAALKPQHGGSVVDLLGQAFPGNWPSGLDPATNTTGGANLPQDQAIFGGLFLLRANNDGTNAHITGNQAASGKLTPDAKTLAIKLRPGIKFSDGTALNAKAVIWNFTRDSKSSCTCAPTWQLRKRHPFTSPDPLTVVVHLAQPNAAILHNFPASNVNWIASPIAFKQMGEKAFSIKPVGAGPFTVVSDKLSTKLVVKRNPNYFRSGLPYLDKLTFEAIGGDQPAYQALLAGQAQAYEGAQTPPVIDQAKSNPKLQVTVQPGTSPYMVQVNTMIPPFNNLRAREALYYATNWEAINKGVFNGDLTVVQGFTAPVDLFYQKTVPGYRTYDLSKAKKIVQELGGLSLELDTIEQDTPMRVITALQTQWEKAGMKVTIKGYTLGGMIKRASSGKWRAVLVTTGAWDPGAGVGLGFRFSSHSPNAAVKDPKLDVLLNESVSTANSAKRGQIYRQIAKYISDHAYGEFGFAIGQAEFAVNGLHAPGLTTKIPALGFNTGIIWGEAWMENG